MDKNSILKLGVERTGVKDDSLFVAQKSGHQVRNGFVLSEQFCKGYAESEYASEYQNEIFNVVKKLEKHEKLVFGFEKKPLFLSLKLDCKYNIGGLKEVYNIGINDRILENCDEDVGKQYLQFIKFYAVNVCGHNEEEYKYKDEDSVLIKIEEFKQKFFQIENKPFPQDERKQLIDIIKAFINYFNSDRFVAMRKFYNFKSEDFVSLIIQSQSNIIKVFGEIVSRDKDKALNQVEGFIEQDFKTIKISENYDFGQIAKFNKIALDCEKKFKDAVKINFSFIDNDLYIEKIQKQKLSSKAQLKMIAELLKKKVITNEEAIERVDKSMINSYLHTCLDEEETKKASKLCKGIPSSIGGGSGRICLTIEKAKEFVSQNENAILVCNETSPKDIEYLKHLQGVVMINGGVTSHASVLARTIRKPCVVNCKDVKIEDKKIYFASEMLKEGDFISIDGENGQIYKGQIKVIDGGDEAQELKYILGIANKLSVMKVKVNADNFADALKAIHFGAGGIGLCRTEHMFFDANRINSVRKMILATDEQERKQALEEMLKMQKEDFIKIFEVAGTLPVTIRFIDPPLHEFLPKTQEEIVDYAKSTNINEDEIKNKLSLLKEFNPMMGHRGCRLLVTYPDIAKMQTQAVIEAAMVVENKLNIKIIPQVMIPLIGDVKEFNFIKEIVRQKADEIIKNNQSHFEYKVGAMIELPRACLLADKIAKECDFLSFGTNDLTQMVYGFSRDDSDKFLGEYQAKDIFETNPFKTLDKVGVGGFIKIACQKAREVKKDIEIGVCGEHGGDEKSIEFFFQNNINYVSCSLYRVPNAIVSCAKVAIKK